MKNILFYTENVNYVLPHKNKIRDLLNLLAKEEGKEIGQLTYIFCSDEYLLEINKQYLHADYLTDVITFDYCQNEFVSGDVFISVERVKENSVLFSQSYFDEMLRVVVHGLLHLCGYKDKKEKEQQQMREKENYSIEKYKTLL